VLKDMSWIQRAHEILDCVCGKWDSLLVVDVFRSFPMIFVALLISFNNVSFGFWMRKGSQISVPVPISLLSLNYSHPRHSIIMY